MERIPKGKHIFIGSGAAEPVRLVEALALRARHFADNPVMHLLTLGPAPYVDRRHEDSFRHNAFFIGPNVREAVHEGRADYTPVFLSQIPRLIRSRRIDVDVALIQTTPPDAFGFVNLGVSVDIVLAAIEAATLVIAEINPNMPLIYGSGFIPMDSIDAWVLHPSKLLVIEREAPDDIALEIGRNVASLVEDEATLQIGIGQIPDATLLALESKKDLGVWTEMLPDGVIDLIEIRFRPIDVTDEQKMSDLFYRFSDETVYRRWMMAVPRMPHRNLLHYLKTDEFKNVAIVAETTKTDAESELIGVGRYHTDPAINYAEVALIVRDDYQGQGIGSTLFAHLLEIAKKNGVEGFTAEVLATNQAMLQVFRKSGLSLESILSSGVYSVKMPFNGEHSPKAPTFSES